MKAKMKANTNTVSTGNTLLQERLANQEQDKISSNSGCTTLVLR